MAAPAEGPPAAAEADPAMEDLRAILNRSPSHSSSDGDGNDYAIFLRDLMQSMQAPAAASAESPAMPDDDGDDDDDYNYLMDTAAGDDADVDEFADEEVDAEELRALVEEEERRERKRRRGGGRTLPQATAVAEPPAVDAPEGEAWDERRVLRVQMQLHMHTQLLVQVMVRAASVAGAHHSGGHRRPQPRRRALGPRASRRRVQAPHVASVLC